MPLTGRCHCGRNQFTVQAPLPEKLTRCRCSFCSKRGLLEDFDAAEHPVTIVDGKHLW